MPGPKSPSFEAVENSLPILWERYKDVAPKAQVKPMGWLEKLLGGGRNIATTDLDNSINVNPANLAGVDPDVLMAHELQHVRQNESRTLPQNLIQRFKQGVLPWESRPDEVEAMAQEYPTRGFRRTADVQLSAGSSGPASLAAVNRLTR